MKMDKSISTLQFETSTACNARCTFCRHKDMTRKGEMPLPDIIDLIYHLAHRAKTVCPFWMQEPTIDRRMPQTLSNIRCYAPKAETILYTNMGYYPKNSWKQILEAGLLDRLIISFYGTDKKTYNKLQPPLDYAQTAKNIKRLWRLKKRLGWSKPHISIRLLITPDTVMKSNKFQERWRPYADRVGFTFLENWNGNNQKVLEFNRRYWGEPAPRVPCARLYNSIDIQCNGDVALCCMDYNCAHKLGNVYRDGWDVWYESPILKKARELHEQKRWDEIPLCKSCTVYAYNHDPRWVEHWLEDEKFAESAVKC